MVSRCNRESAHEKRADTLALVGVSDDEGDLGDRRVALIAHKARVSHYWSVGSVGSFAITVAVRGLSRSKAISPTIIPGSDSATV
jgi:hypothetical protein